MNNYKPRSAAPRDDEDSSANKRDSVNVDGSENREVFTKVVRRRSKKVAESKL